MPKLWDGTIEAHRAAVREATIAATASLVEEHGVSGVTMSQIAQRTGIGRATLYKYFPDVEAILLAWHESHVAAHVAQLAAARDSARGGPMDRLRSVLDTYARLSHGHDGSERVDGLHRGEHVSHAEAALRALLGDMLTDAAAEGSVRGDVPPDELALYCLNALRAAGPLPSRAAVERLVKVTVAGLGETRHPGHTSSAR